MVVLNLAIAVLEPWFLPTAMYDGQYTVARISDYYAAERPDVVFLGSSHALDGLDPQVAHSVLASSGVPANALNLAVTGIRLDVMHLILKNVIRDDKKPAVVVLGVRPEDLGAPPNSYTSLPYTEIVKRADDVEFAGTTLDLKLGFVTQQVCIFCRDLSLIRNALSIAFNPYDPLHKFYRPGPDHMTWPADGFYSPAEHSQAPANIMEMAPEYSRQWPVNTPHPH